MITFSLIAKSIKIEKLEKKMFANEQYGRHACKKLENDSNNLLLDSGILIISIHCI